MPLRPVTDAGVADCFPAVERAVEQHGGSVCYGWRFWELPRAFVEAEFHAVWRSPDAGLIDLTPIPEHFAPSDGIVFAVDPSRIYQGRQVNNVRLALTSHPAIHEFFRGCDDAYELMNRGVRAEQHGVITLAGSEKDELLRIERRKAVALMQVMNHLPKVGRNESCPCGSWKKFKKCHGAV